MKKLIRDPKASVSEILKPTEYERWESREDFKEEVSELAVTFLSCAFAFAMLIAIVFLL